MHIIISKNRKSRPSPFIAAVLASCLCLIAGPQARAEETQDSQAFISLTRTPLDEARLPTNTSVVRQETIEKLGVQNAGDALDYLTGVYVQKNSGLGSTRLPKMRGFLNKQMAVYVDNRRVTPDVTGNVDLAQIPAEQIEKIEIVRGGASVLYGPNAEGGVIHIITKRAKAYTPQAKASLTFKSFDTETLQAEASHKKDRLEGYASGSYTKSNGFMRNSQFENKSAGGNVAYDFGRAGKTAIDFSVARSENGNPGGTAFNVQQFDGTRERTPRSETNKQFDNNDSVRLEHALSLAQTEAGPVNLTVRLSGLENKRRSITSATSISTHTINTHNVFTQLDLPFGFTMGYDYERSFISSPFVRVPQTNSWGVFFQENLEIGNLNVIPGVRYDNSTEWGNTTNPRLSVIYRPVPVLKLSANAGSAFQAPTFADFTDYDPVTGSAVPRTEPGPFPEKSWHYDFGVEVQAHESLSLKATAFRADIKDRLSFQSTGFGGTTKNLQDSFNQGVEAEITHQIRDLFLQQVNYTYTQSEGKGTGFSSDFIALRFTPQHRVNYLTQVKILPADADLSSVLQYVSEQYTGNQTLGLKLPDYVVWNLAVAKKIGIVELKAGVDNVLDRRYAQNATEGFPPFVPDLYFPQPGRSFWGTVTVKLF